MAALDPARQLLHFGAFELDSAAGELRRKGIKLKVQEQPLRALSALVERRGEIVSREELRQQLWPADTFVDFETSLNAAVRKLRQTLGDDADSPRFIETVPKRGYRFIAPVEISDRAQAYPGGGSAGGALSKETVWFVGRRAWLLLLVLVVLALVIGASVSLYITRKTARIDSVAVLPFTINAINSERELIADDVTAGLIDGLSHLRGLKVMSRSSVSRYKGREVDPRIVGRELNVSSILTGAIVQDGNTLIVSAELVNANDGSHLWGREIRETTSDVLGMQAELSRAVSEWLDPTLSRAAVAELGNAGTTNREAYALYVKGRYFADRWDAEDWKRALASFQQAIEIDPGYTQAYAGAAEAYAALTFYALIPWREGIQKAKTAANKALELSPNLADGYCGLAIASYVNREWEQSEQLARHCVQLNPNFVPGHQYHAWTLGSLGRIKEALTEEKLALDLNPASIIANHFLADAYFYSRDYDGAIEQQRQALEMSPDDADLRDSLATSCLLSGKYDQAAQEYQRSLSLYGEPDRARRLERSYKERGIAGVLKALIEFHNDPKRPNRYDPDYVAKIYALLHDRENAFLWLERAYQDRETAGGGMLMDVLITPELDDVRSDPRYKALLGRLGFPPSAISAL